MAELSRLRLVSKAWKELIENTLTLWTYISKDYPSIVARDCLRWLETHLLQIKHFHTRLSFMEALIELLKLLQPHSYRWKTLYYSIVDGADDHRIPNSSFLESQDSRVFTSSRYPYTVVFQPPPWLGEFSLIVKEKPQLKRFLTYSSRTQLSDSSSCAVPAQKTRTIRPHLLRVHRNSRRLIGGSYSSCHPTPHYHPYLVTRLHAELSAGFTTLEEPHMLGDALAQFMVRIGNPPRIGKAMLLVSSEFELKWSIRSSGVPILLRMVGYCPGSLIGWVRDPVAPLGSQLDLVVDLTTLHRKTIGALGKWREVTKLSIGWKTEPSLYDADEVVSAHDF
ncbi:glycoside hydrolase family 5 protein [Tulasnella calospora MUT 4182]|uniref:Glycoside hydrolase family 5 protein n=1 Tax=Tulasnella calospora MUT 4182 TaxID=1051891 RepID=A0A0C3QQB2_9AGAM|nr:glycoside hydrolase family 5 protein [Tulasnella calospora MUT 4182]